MSLIFIGEAMLELRGTNDATHLGYGGDVLNTAIHLARLGHHVKLATALGADPYSNQMKLKWQAAGVDTELVLVDPERLPGLYAIHTDSHGERQFFYWRQVSAAKRMHQLEGVHQIESAVKNSSGLYFSLISLAILPEEGREWLCHLASELKARGKTVVFDGNYRPKLWESLESARHWRDRGIAVSTLGLPTLADEQLLDNQSNRQSVAEHWNRLGCGEVVVKLGDQGCQIQSGALVSTLPITSIRDTSGAGDAFNAGYWHARLMGRSEPQSALSGHALAGWVITQSGAIPEATTEAPYKRLQNTPRSIA